MENQSSLHICMNLEGGGDKNKKDGKTGEKLLLETVVHYSGCFATTQHAID